MKMVMCKFAQNEVAHQRLLVGSKKSVQQGHSHFYARSVHRVREHGKMAKTPLAAFFNRPLICFAPIEVSAQIDERPRSCRRFPETISTTSTANQPSHTLVFAQYVGAS